MVNGNSRAGKVGVIGAGSMGSGLAAHFANCGWQVELLDQGEIAQQALEKIVKTGLLYDPAWAARIAPGNAESDLGRLAEADWVVEAIIEQIEPKRQLFSRLADVVSGDCLLATNTSGLGIAEMSSHLPESARERFLGAHFFNPPRQMALLELIPTDESTAQVVDGFWSFAENVLGKRVVQAKDRPGFITTRIGIYALAASLSAAERLGITPEEADMLMGPLIGRPRSGVFRLADLVGLDIIASIIRNQTERLPNDFFLQAFSLPSTLQKLIDSGRLGEKSGAGFYQKEGKTIRTLDFASMEYRDRIEANVPMDPDLHKAPLPERIKAALFLPSPYGDFAREALMLPIAYAAEYAEEIAWDIPSIDQAMRLGYNWQLGPFEYWDAIASGVWEDQIGLLANRPNISGLDAALEILSQLPAAPQKAPDVIEAMRREGYDAFYRREDGVARYFDFAGHMAEKDIEYDFIVIDDLKASGAEIEATKEASAIDLDDQVMLIEFHTKANALTPELIAFTASCIERAEREFDAVVIGNQGSMFSAGFNLKLFLDSMEKADWSGMERMLKDLQGAVLKLKYAKVPVVAAVQGMALGGGCEVMLHCAQSVAHAEANIGLVEPLVGLMPAGGGTTLLTDRAIAVAAQDEDPFAHLKQIFAVLSQGKRSSNACEAKRLGYLTANDGISMSADRLLFHAKMRAIGLAHGAYRVPDRRPMRALGEDAFARLMMEVHWAREAQQISEHDALIAEKIAFVMSGGRVKGAVDASEEYFHELERQVFVELCQTEATKARIEHMLATGKPLRN